MLVYNVEDHIRQIMGVIDQCLADKQILAVLAEFNFDRDRILVGRSLCEAVQEFQNEERESSRIRKSLEELTEARKETYARYLKHVSVAREKLPKRHGKEDVYPESDETVFPVWIENAIVFYSNIGYSAQEMQKAGIEKAELDQARAMVESIRDAYRQQKNAQDVQKEKTKDRDKLLNELLYWHLKFKTVTQAALQDQPDKLTLLGYEIES